MTQRFAPYRVIDARNHDPLIVIPKQYSGFTAASRASRAARAARPKGGAAPGGSGIPAALGEEFAALARRHGVCGAQLAVHHAGTTAAFEFGELEHGGGRPVTRDAAVPIGSVTKAFTATLAMILVADGDLDLDEPLGEHLPELGALGDELSVRHLLSHTGGFASGPDSTELSSGSLRRYVADHCHHGNLVLPPGAGFSYSNMGYILAGRLIEVITGMSWAEAMESILLRPLGVTPAFTDPVTAGPPARPVATGHSVNLARGRTTPVRQSLAVAEAPAGSLAASAMDLVALGRLHLPPGLPAVLPADHAELMRRPAPAADPFGLADAWGLGLALFRGAGTGWAGHDGNADGTACYLRVDPAAGWAVALTANTNTGIGLWQDLVAWMAAAGIPFATAPAAESATGAQAGPPPDCAGTYVNGDSEYVVTESAGRASLAVDGEEYVMLAGPDGLTFSLLDPTSGQRLPGGRFQRDPASGEIRGMQVNGRLASRHAAVGAAARR
ncbi:MAG TPA: serine hydrolase domain-containing protein [Streptosporangiaceae bacterium]